MSNMRVVKNEAGFTKLDNKLIKNKRLSLKAKGLMALCLSFRSDWEYSVSHLCTLSRDGKDSVYSAINELITEGFCHRSQENGGEFKKVLYTFYESKSLNPNLKKCLPQRDFPYAENPQLTRTRSSSSKKIKENNNNARVTKESPPPLLTLSEKEEMRLRVTGLTDQQFEHGWAFFEEKRKSETVNNPSGMIAKAGLEGWNIPLQRVVARTLTPSSRSNEPFSKDYINKVKDRIANGNTKITFDQPVKNVDVKVLEDKNWCDSLVCGKPYQRKGDLCVYEDQVVFPNLQDQEPLKFGALGFRDRFECNLRKIEPVPSIARVLRM